MVTTTKTKIDIKGGQLALVKSDPVYITMIEKAQADVTGQSELFEKLGLRPGDHEAFFNTNVVLVNYNVLGPKIKKLVEAIGETEFMQIIAPDLIQNWKKQVDKDGVERQYLQLEGAMGSSVLNLDKYWREHFGEGLVHVLNVSAEKRTRFFSPIKSGFDFFMQIHSDKFGLDFETFRLVNKTPGHLPNVNLKDDFYKDVQNTLDSFVGAKIKHLEFLTMSGKVCLSGVELEGRVEINSPAPTMVRMSPCTLKNVSVEIGPGGEILKKTNLEN
jgi:hypothetical protein